MLGDPEKRAGFDRFGASTKPAPYDFGFTRNFDDIFGDLFNDFFGDTQRRRTRKGEDLRYNLEIEFEEAVFGVEKEIEIPYEVKLQLPARGKGRARISADRVPGMRREEAR